MKYKFRFQKILDIKDKLGESKKAEINAIMKDIQDANENLELLVKSKENKKNEMLNLMSEGTNINNIRFFCGIVNSMDINIDKLREKIFFLEEKLELKKREYIEIAKEKKTLDNLKDKDLMRFNEHLKKEEEKFIDQIVTFKTRVSN
ncbi:flagellar export protein FliJ [Alkalithermobacter paradoxus]|uniref:Flagellar FliJ protein n=1 Tax=Alkalithermobacter paradoxus TaxID=29349 RepID=A0A1V4IAR0_9FIRM|nr:flagellar biosynthesis chaperone [[Clostridium] thermoalcaliphilum]